jgi:apolipoprotein N-acyltransferase
MIGKLLAVTASGLMLAAALPKFNLTILLWIGLIPLLWALQGVQGRKAFILGYCNGLAQNLLIMLDHYVTVIYGNSVAGQYYAASPLAGYISI